MLEERAQGLAAVHVEDPGKTYPGALIRLSVPVAWLAVLNEANETFGRTTLKLGPKWLCSALVGYTMVFRKTLVPFRKMQYETLSWKRPVPQCREKTVGR